MRRWRRTPFSGEGDSGMETTYYTITAREIVMSGDGVRQAAGAGRQLVCVRRAGSAQGRTAGDNVIDLSAWKAARDVRTAETADGEAQETSTQRRESRGRETPVRPVLFWGELLATVSVLGVAVLLMARLLAAV